MLKLMVRHTHHVADVIKGQTPILRGHYQKIYLGPPITCTLLRPLDAVLFRRSGDSPVRGGEGKRESPALPERSRGARLS